MMNAWEWQDYALCRGRNVAMFYPTRSEDIERVMPGIKALCSACAVQEECLRWAIAKREKGLWAGTTEEERKAMVRRQRAELAQLPDS